MNFIKQYLNLFILGIVLAIVAWGGIQTYRLAVAKGQITVFEEREAAQRRDQARRDASNLRNKERTDENHAAASARARAVVVRPATPRRVTYKAPAPISPDQSASCVTRGELLQTVAEVSRRHSERVDGLLTEFARRDAVRLTELARLGEEVGAAFRACSEYAKGLE